VGRSVGPRIGIDTEQRNWDTFAVPSIPHMERHAVCRPNQRNRPHAAERSSYSSVDVVQELNEHWWCMVAGRTRRTRGDL